MFLFVGVGGFAVVFFAGVGLVDEVTPLFATGDHAVDGAPVGESAYIAVVDEDIGLELAGEVGIVIGGLLGVVTVGCIELHTALTTPVDGVVEELTFPTGPEDEPVMVVDEHLERVDGEGALLANLGIAVLDDCSVKIDCDNHSKLGMRN